MRIYIHENGKEVSESLQTMKAFRFSLSDNYWSQSQGQEKKNKTKKRNANLIGRTT